MNYFINRIFTRTLTIWLPLGILTLNIGGVLGQSSKWFGEQTINSVVLLEKKVGEKYVPHGTGFLIYDYRKNAAATVVTCAHLLKGDNIYVVVRADTVFAKTLKDSSKAGVKMGDSEWYLDGPNLRLEVVLKRDSSFVADDSLDIAAFTVGLGTRGKLDSLEVQVTKATMISRSSIRGKHETHLGEEVYFVGFPFGIGTKYGAFLEGLFAEECPNPLIRSGTIAWLSSDKNEYLLDAFSYAGNSGSPIFTKVTLAKPGPFLVGMIFGHLGAGQENFGLARCVWIDDILDVVEKAETLETH